MIKAGTVTGTASAQLLELGFIPDFFILVNQTQVKVYMWEANMTDAYAFKIETASTANAMITSGGFTKVTTGGAPTVSSGTTPGTGVGLTLGQTALANSDVANYIAIKSG